MPKHKARGARLTQYESDSAKRILAFCRSVWPSLVRRVKGASPPPMHIFERLLGTMCDPVSENPAHRKFYDVLVSYLFDKLYHRANLPPSFRPIARFA